MPHIRPPTASRIYPASSLPRRPSALRNRARMIMQEKPPPSPEVKFFPDGSQPTLSFLRHLKLYMRFMQCFGLCPYRVDALLDYQTAQLDWRAAAWSLLLFISLGLVLLPWPVAGYVLIYRADLERLEFFAIISFLFRTVIFTQGPLILAITVTKLRHIPAVIQQIQTALAGTQNTHSSRTIHLTTYAVLTWNFTFVLSCLLSFYFSFREISPTFNEIVQAWLQGILGPSAHIMPFACFLINGLTLAFCLCCEAFPLGILLVFLLSTGTGYDKMKEDLAGIHADSQSREPGRNTQVIAALAGIRQRYRLLQCCFVEIDGIFSHLILISALREVVGFIALLGAALQVERPRESWEESHDTVSVVDRTSRTLIFALGGLGLANFVIKVCATVSIHEKVQSVRDDMKRIAADTDMEDVRSECEVFISRCDYKDGSVSAGGFFHITKEFMLTWAELMITYAVLIYQTHDTKTDMRELASKSQLHELRVQLEKQAERVNQCTLDQATLSQLVALLRSALLDPGLNLSAPSLDTLQPADLHDVVVDAGD
ncbi:uncharacterized protein LOC129599736 [Paramacrobiotus metropolitanus]|uniref:uncharacterized protein LOC129599736 n=1 Tax=Paramacrobiotus metropolitanus TaxID=2943436 RepID=UPI002446018F|nr:uncharacterized protein LOC129599736 [Paramacrobiotus metropolitanus]